MIKGGVDIGTDSIDRQCPDVLSTWRTAIDGWETVKQGSKDLAASRNYH